MSTRCKNLKRISALEGRALSAASQPGVTAYNRINPRDPVALPRGSFSKQPKVSGGQFNNSNGVAASVSGGQGNSASVGWASVCGGLFNTASGGHASVCGGTGNTAAGFEAVVIGGSNITDNNSNSIAPGAPLNYP